MSMCTTDKTLNVHRLLLVISVTILSLAAWATLAALGPSAHAAVHDPHLHHHHDASSASASGALSAILFFVASWTVMTIAMMLPTSLPVLTTFQVVAGQRRDRALLLALVVIGYLASWAAFGGLAHFGQQLFQQLLATSAWAREHVPMTGGLILIGAGAYQFTKLKYTCLDKCRSPLGFVIAHWQGRHDRWQAFRLGIDHGLFCVGCCWALMLLMFVVGTANLAWMLILAAIMAVEKNVSFGRALGRPLGAALVALGIASLVS